MAIFEGIGRVGDYAQLRNLRREMKYRIKTGGSLAQAMGAPVQPGKVKSDEAQKMREKSDANREAQIRISMIRSSGSRCGARHLSVR